MRTAAAHKRVISQTAVHIGFGLALALGLVYLLAGKVASTLGQLGAVMSGEPTPASAMKSLVGMLCSAGALARGLLMITS